MTKVIGSLAAAALLTALALPGSAGAADTKRADGLTNPTSQLTEVSSQRRARRRARAARRYYRGRRYYRPYYYNDYAYAPYPYPYYRRYYGPGVYFGGPGFSFGFGY